MVEAVFWGDVYVSGRNFVTLYTSIGVMGLFALHRCTIDVLSAT